MLRLCDNWVLEVYGFGKKLSDYISYFFVLYVENVYDASAMFKHRIRIRGNQFLNKLLYDNCNSIRSIYERYKEVAINVFTCKSCIEVFVELRHKDYKINEE